MGTDIAADPAPAAPPADPFAAAAKFLAAAPEPAVTPTAESPEAPTEAPEGASEAEGEAGAESKGETPEASEATDETGDDDTDGTKALRAAVGRDPALAMVPEIRRRLGLPSLGEKEDEASAEPADPLDDAKVREAYDAAIKEGDEVKAARILARAEARAEVRPIVDAVKTLLETQREAARRAEIAAFKAAHPDWEKHDRALAAEIRRQQAKGNTVDLEDVWKIVVRPGPAPKSAVATEAAKAVQAAGAKVAASKGAVAASAAAAPTNQRAAAIPTTAAPAVPVSPAHKALESVFGKAEAPKGTPLYDPKLLTTLPLRR